MKIPTPDEMPTESGAATEAEVDRITRDLIDQLRDPKKTRATARGRHDIIVAVAARMRAAKWLASVKRGGARDCGASSVVTVTRPPAFKTPRTRKCNCPKDAR